MKKKRLIWQIFPSYLLITIFSLIGVSWYASSAFKTFYLNQTAKNLKTNAFVISEQFKMQVFNNNLVKIDSLAKLLGKKSNLRLTIILPDGNVIGDSEKNPKQMDNHLDRPEIIEAKSSLNGLSIRYSYTLKKNMMYRAIPVYKNKKIIGIVRVSTPIDSIEKALKDIYTKIIFAGILISFFAAFVSLLVSRKINQPLREIRKGAMDFAKGDFSKKLIIPSTEEMGVLAETMNEMAKELGHRIQTITKQRNEQQAVLSSMVEGVLAIDANQSILNINKVAKKLLSANTENIVGKSIQEVIRNSQLNSLIIENLQTQKTINKEIIFYTNKQKKLKIHVTTLYNENDSSIGAMVVLNDITKLKHLEFVRQDFVANVSHELKTPITSIKGFTETLLGGAINDKKEATHFLNIIKKQSDRLNSIIDDLLSLSEIEQQSEKREIFFEFSSISNILCNAIELCENTAKKKTVNLKCICDKNVEVKINAPLLEQAIVNLIDNAIKYSYEKSDVIIKTMVNNKKELEIKVVDKGIGIEEKHLSRLFERFYRTDKARSRKLGGTGLGLSIVKHIVNVHNGRIDVKSTLGKGSTFTLYIP